MDCSFGIIYPILNHVTKLKSDFKCQTVKPLEEQGLTVVFNL